MVAGKPDESWSGSLIKLTFAFVLRVETLTFWSDHLSYTAKAMMSRTVIGSDDLQCVLHIHH